jgi:hypothetical protein
VGANGRWSVGDDVSVSGGGEWAWLESEEYRADALKKLSNFLVEVSVGGNAEAAGISFGPFKDFLVPLRGVHGTKLLQVEVDASNQTWVFRAEGTMMSREWWDSAIHSVRDILDGILTLKAHKADRVVFHGLAVRRFDSSCRLSIVLTCFRFAQRLRVSLASWCRQTIPTGAFEIIVVNPDSPDATHQVLATMASAYPEVRVRELAVPSALARNKGAMINRGIKASRGEWIWLTDADCVYPNTAAEQVLSRTGSHQVLFYGERHHLTRRATDALLAGRLVGATDLTALRDFTEGRPDNHPWGYSQIAHRSVMERIRYREDLNGFSASDGSFLDDCRRSGVALVRIDALQCFHLSHPFAWDGATAFL